GDLLQHLGLLAVTTLDAVVVAVGQAPVLGTYWAIADGDRRAIGELLAAEAAAGGNLAVQLRGARRVLGELGQGGLHRPLFELAAGEVDAVDRDPPVPVQLLPALLRLLAVEGVFDLDRAGMGAALPGDAQA